MEKLKSILLWALVWLNVALLVGWAFKLTSPPAAGQFRAQSNYLMIPGAIQAGNGSVVYIVDTSAGVLSAIYYNDGTGRIQPMVPVDLNREFQRMANGGR
jgi:hypothetical protein